MHAIPALVRLRAVLMPQRCGRVLAVLSLFFFFFVGCALLSWAVFFCWQLVCMPVKYLKIMLRI